MTTKIFVGQLDFKTTEEELNNHFAQAGKVSKATIITRGRRSLGYGFVEYESQEDAEKAVTQFNLTPFRERELKVEIARPLAPQTFPPRRRVNPNRGGRRPYAEGAYQDTNQGPSDVVYPPRSQNPNQSSYTGSKPRNNYQSHAYPPPRQSYPQSQSYSQSQSQSYSQSHTRSYPNAIPRQNNFRGPTRQTEEYNNRLPRPTEDYNSRPYRRPNTYYDNPPPSNNNTRNFRGRPRTNAYADGDAPRSTNVPPVSGVTANARRLPLKKETVPAPPKILSKTAVFVANLPFSVSNEGLSKIFEAYNPKNAHVVKTRNGRSRGYGFVDFGSEEDQKKAIEEKNQFQVNDERSTAEKPREPRRITVSISHSGAPTEEQ